MKKKARQRTGVGLSENLLEKASSYDFVIPYVGRWVVIVDDQVVSDGETANDAISKISKKIKREDSLLFKVPAEPDKLLVV